MCHNRSSLPTFGATKTALSVGTADMVFGDVELTAYALDKSCTGKSPGDPFFAITSTGKRAIAGRTVAVDPSLIPYGSVVYIQGVGWRIAEDTGGAIRGKHIDVLMDSRQKAIGFGVHRHCMVRVYTPDVSASKMAIENGVPT